jgi:hypothetical protein
LPRELAWKCPSRYSANWTVHGGRPRQIKRICTVGRFIDRLFALETMAKSDSFFIRAEVDTNGVTYAETEIDLGSFVNLGVSKSTLLRVHNVACTYLDAADPGAAINETATNSKVSWQLCTQSQTAIVYPGSDKSVVTSGGLDIFADGTRTIFVGEAPDVNPQNWTNGYLIGVDSLFLATDLSNSLDSGNLTIGIIMECTLETATQASSTALALSQQ